MPGPVSVTWKLRSALPAPRPASFRRNTIRPESVNLMALLTRLSRICRMRVTSPITASGASGAATA
ncbi:hypothetical protein D3C85_1165930 [compost metagenome]